MPKGPKGEKRPADVIGTAVMVAKIATGEIEEETDGKEYARKDGKKAVGHGQRISLRHNALRSPE